MMSPVARRPLRDDSSIGASNDPLRGVFLEFKEPDPLGVVDTDTKTPAFPVWRVRMSARVNVS